MADRMSMNIARARRNWRPQGKLRPPESHVTRDGDMVCPTCLRWGRDDCREHRSASRGGS